MDQLTGDGMDKKGTEVSESKDAMDRRIKVSNLYPANMQRDDGRSY